MAGQDGLTADAEAIPRRDASVLTLSDCWRDFIRRRTPPFLAAAFLAASRGGNLGALLAVLDPDVVLYADAAAVPSGVPATLRGAAAVASGALASSARSRYSGLALVNGTPGIVMAPGGRLVVALALTIDDGKITRIEVIANPARLQQLDLAVLN